MLFRSQTGEHITFDQFLALLKFWDMTEDEQKNIVELIGVDEPKK